MAVTFQVAHNCPNDVLAVFGTTDQLLGADGRPLPITAYGYTSALQRAFTAEDYDPTTGQLKDGAEAREHTPAEMREYTLALLRAVEAALVPERTSVFLEEPSRASRA